jgi:uncharacterized protein YneF (UPF0154 family)
MLPGYTGVSDVEVRSLLKFFIVVLVLALLVSLASGFYFLMADQGDKNKRRTFHSLGVRVSLAICLVLLIIYGVASGQLMSRAPWEQSNAAQDADHTD